MTREERDAMFHVGDTVRIREWDDMEAEFGLNSNGNIGCRHVFTTDMQICCGEICVIRSIDPDGHVDFENPCGFWSFSTDMITPVANIADHTVDFTAAQDALSELLYLK